MAAYINTKAYLQVKVITDPPSSGCEFYWQDWDHTDEWFTFPMPDLPPGTKVVSVTYRYIPPPTAEEIECARLSFPDLPVGRPAD